MYVLFVALLTTPSLQFLLFKSNVTNKSYKVNDEVSLLFVPSRRVFPVGNVRLCPNKLLQNPQIFL